MTYTEFLARKSEIAQPVGFRDLPPLPTALKPFQRAIVEWALRRGRAAVFANTGLGKTLMQLAWARAIADVEEFPILLLCPLAVAQQTCEEAEKFGISGVAYARDQYRVKTDIVVTNYERFDKFDIEKFGGVVLDESGIIKSEDGKTRKALTDACANVRWKLCCTATPAPNDYTELGQHAEFLDIMTAKEMLSMYFVHDGSIRAGDSASGDGWRLKGHARRAFWRWLASWAVVIRSPEDLGFDGAEYRLPPLRIEQVTVETEAKPRDGMLFPDEARTLRERIGARRDTIEERCRRAAEIVAREPAEPWLVWCGLNAEADLMETLIPGARQVAGRHDLDTKVSRLLGFKKGDPFHLVTKAGIAGHGMNYFHCSRAVFVGLNDSFEQLYQAIRRCWRFGQEREVVVYLVASDREGAVVANLRRKEQDFSAMQDAMAEHMRELMSENVRGIAPARDAYDPQTKMELPEWLS